MKVQQDSVTARDLGLLALRLGVGGTLFAHGAQKLFGWFGGGGLEQTAATFEQLGFRPGKLNAVAAGLGEAGGGALLSVGLGTPAAGAAVAGTMIVASSMHVDQGFFSTKGGFEFPAVLGWSAAALALTGPGRFSLDHSLGHRLNRSWMRNLALAAAAPAALAIIARRRRAVAEASVPEHDPAPERVLAN
jgi:putative oxidoreductase